MDNSPCPVSDTETIVRRIFSPHQVDVNTGKPNPFAFKDADTRGLSVDRLTYTNEEVMHLRGKEKAAKDSETRPADKKITYQGYVSAAVADIRKIFSADESRAFFVFDTALPEHDCHCDVFQQSGGTDAERSKLRRQLMKSFSEKLIKAPE